MTSDEFATKIKSKYPYYNKVDNYTLTQQMIKKYPTYKDQVTIAPEDKITGLPKTLLNVSQGAGSVARSVGLGGIVDVISNSGAMPGIKKRTGINPLINSQDPVNKQGLVERISKDAVGAASFAIPVGKIGLLGKLGLVKNTSKIGTKLAGATAEFGAKGAVRGGMIGAAQPDANLESVKNSALIGGVAEPLTLGVGAYRNLLTKGGVARTAEKVATEATEKGAKVNQDDLFNLIRGEVDKTFGTGVKTKRELNALLAEKTKGNIKTIVETTKTPVKYSQEPATFNPKELLDWRKQISAREGSRSLFQKLGQGKTVESETRTAISKALKQIAPEIRTADQAYTLYSKLHGDPVKLLALLGIGYAGKKLVGGQLSSILSLLAK